MFAGGAGKRVAGDDYPGAVDRGCGREFARNFESDWADMDVAIRGVVCVVGGGDAAFQGWRAGDADDGMVWAAGVLLGEERDCVQQDACAFAAAGLGWFVELFVVSGACAGDGYLGMAASAESRAVFGLVRGDWEQPVGGVFVLLGGGAAVASVRAVDWGDESAARDRCWMVTGG